MNPGDLAEDIESTGICWLSDRPCDGLCVAYDPTVSEDEHPKWPRCVILRSIYRGAEGVLRLSAALKDLVGGMDPGLNADEPPIIPR